jgi:hypothetical protein
MKRQGALSTPIRGSTGGEGSWGPADLGVGGCRLVNCYSLVRGSSQSSGCIFRCVGVVGNGQVHNLDCLLEIMGFCAVLCCWFEWAVLRCGMLFRVVSAHQVSHVSRAVRCCVVSMYPTPLACALCYCSVGAWPGFVVGASETETWCQGRNRPLQSVPQSPP